MDIPQRPHWPHLDTRPLLGANGTEAMGVLLSQNGAPWQDASHLVDYLKVGPFMGREAIAHLAARYPLLLHLDDTLSGNDLLSDETLAAISAWVEQTGTPWTSAHIGFGVSGVTQDEAHISQPTTNILSRDQARENIVRNARHLARHLPVPLLLENVPLFPNAAHIHVCEPDFVRDVLVDSGCDLLLDLAHARVSANVLKMDIYDYIQVLPLDRVRELHLSGPRALHELDARRQRILVENARTVADRISFGQQSLVDAHEALRSADYDLLRWVLQRTQPWAVSLEYFYSPQPLREQLEALAGIVGRQAV